MERKCVQCGKRFILTDSEIEFYKSKGLSLPKRCQICRDANRRTKAVMNGNNAQKGYEGAYVSAEANRQYHKKSKVKASPIHYIIALFIIVAIGFITVKFGDFTNPANYTNATANNAHQQFEYTFANENLWVSHFQKHGHEFGYSTKEQYLQGANEVINNPNALHKVQNDGDDCYYLQSTDEFVVVSSYGDIRTYFRPGDGNSNEGLEYFNRQHKTVYPWFSRIHSFSLLFIPLTVI